MDGMYWLLTPEFGEAVFAVEFYAGVGVVVVGVVVVFAGLVVFTGTGVVVFAGLVVLVVVVVVFVFT
jgi:hypothetical protein